MKVDIAIKLKGICREAATGFDHDHRKILSAAAVVENIILKFVSRRDRVVAVLEKPHRYPRVIVHERVVPNLEVDEGCNRVVGRIHPYELRVIVNRLRDAKHIVVNPDVVRRRVAKTIIVKRRVADVDKFVAVHFHVISRCLNHVGVLIRRIKVGGCYLAKHIVENGNAVPALNSIGATVRSGHTGRRSTIE